MSKDATVRVCATAVSCSDFSPGGCQVSYGEPIALRGQMDLEPVAPAALADPRPTGDVESLKD